MDQGLCNGCIDRRTRVSSVNQDSEYEVAHVDMGTQFIYTKTSSTSRSGLSSLTS